MKRWIGLFAMCVALSGCGSGKPATTSSRPSTQSTATSRMPPAGLLGTYATTLTGKEHFHGPGANLLSPGTPGTGKWELTLSLASATFAQPQNGFQVTVKAVYPADGQIQLAASSCDAELSPETAGLYTYRVEGSQLSFTEIHDSCVDRAATLTEELWHRP
jgi:hypothetical protein